MIMIMMVKSGDNNEGDDVDDVINHIAIMMMMII